ncbi:MAG: tryptophan synthase subunit alpha [Clostridiales bacterium]|jgi:tryptophan synthase alpha chain|nr:tryptophan synthase subunit alpha [Clostridiales bacterium]
MPLKLICYLSYGYPTLERSFEVAKAYVEAGCDVIECDLPAADPYLESDFIASRMRKALENCSDYDKYLSGIAAMKKALPSARFILLAYESTVIKIGVQKIIDFCLANDMRDLIFVGLKDGQIKNRLIAAGLKISCYVQYHLDPAELAAAKESNGFIYLQAKPASGKIKPGFESLDKCVARVRQIADGRKIYCGVGVATPQDVASAAASGADGVFIGSVILKLHDDIPALKSTIALFKAAASGAIS